MIGRGRGFGAADDFADFDAVCVRGGNEQVVEANVRRPRRKRVPRLGTVELPVTVGIAGVEYQLNRAPLDSAATQPHERPEPMREFAKVEQIAWRQRVEITGEDVEPVLMAGNRGQEHSKFEHTPPLCPRRVERAQVEPENA